MYLSDLKEKFNYAFIMDPTYYFLFLFPVYILLGQIYVNLPRVRINTYRGYGGNIGDRTEIGHFGYIKSRIFILTLNMEVQKFRKFSANPSESIFKVNDSH